MEYYAVNGGQELYHYGIKGMHWYQRRYQNEDGSLTSEGRAHYGVKGVRDKAKSSVTKLKSKVTGDSLTDEEKDARKTKAKKIAIAAGVTAAVAVTAVVAYKNKDLIADLYKEKSVAVVKAKREVAKTESALKDATTRTKAANKIHQKAVEAVNDSSYAYDKAIYERNKRIMMGQTDGKNSSSVYKTKEKFFDDSAAEARAKWKKEAAVKETQAAASAHVQAKKNLQSAKDQRFVARVKAGKSDAEDWSTASKTAKEEAGKWIANQKNANKANQVANEGNRAKGGVKAAIAAGGIIGAAELASRGLNAYSNAVQSAERAKQTTYRVKQQLKDEQEKQKKKKSR